MNNLAIKLQARYKAVAGLLLGFAGPLLTFYQANQNLTVKALVFSILSGVVTGGAVHQVPNITNTTNEGLDK